MLEEFLRLSPDAAVVVDHDGLIRAANAMAETMFGVSEGALIGQPVEALLPEPLRSVHARHRRSFSAAPHRRPMGVGLDLRGRRADGTEFPVDISLAPLEAEGVAMVLATVRDRTEQQRVRSELERAEADSRMFAERNRIARDLHDRVIQRIFAAGMGLDAVARSQEDDDLRARLDALTDQLDLAVREIRTSIFTLRTHPDAGDAGVRAQLIDVATEMTPALGFAPTFDFQGPVDTATTGQVCDEVVAVVHEALSNVARHAAANHASVTVTASGKEVVVVVTDDGRGMSSTARRSGLRNLAERAADLGGSLTLDEPGRAVGSAGPGTRLTWSASLSAGDVL